jgi:hypothetical protein
MTTWLQLFQIKYQQFKETLHEQAFSRRRFGRRLRRAGTVRPGHRSTPKRVGWRLLSTNWPHL